MLQSGKTRRSLTQNMRLRKTRTVLEDVIPHWPMFTAAPATALANRDAPAALAVMIIKWLRWSCPTVPTLPGSTNRIVEEEVTWPDYSVVQNKRDNGEQRGCQILLRCFCYNDDIVLVCFDRCFINLTFIHFLGIFSHITLK